MLLLLLLLPHLCLSVSEYYLSPQGSDSWDGSSPTHSPGTNTGPWETLQHAIEALRAQRPANPGPEDRASLQLLQGTYFLEQTLKLNRVKDSYLDISAYKGAFVTISGGRELNSDWEQEGSVRSTTFEGSCAEIWLDTWRLVPARSPNTEWGANHFVGDGPWHKITGLLEETPTCTRNSSQFSQNCPDSDRLGFVLTDEVDPNWEDLEQTEVLIYHSWVAEYARVANVTTVNGRRELRFQTPLKHDPVGQWVKSGDWRFVVLNNRALLDQEGEVVCTNIGENEARVSYIPPEGLEDKSPVVATLKVLLDISQCNHITLTGLNFRHSTSDGQEGPYAWGAESAVRLTHVEDVLLDDCQFSHLGMIGVYVQNSARVSIINSYFWDIGYHGIMLRQDHADSEDDSNVQDDILVDNNVFSGCGVSYYWQAAAVWVGGMRNITVSHNEITHVTNHALRIVAARAKNANNGEFVYNIEFNHIHNYGSTISSDYGGIYIGGGDVCGNGNAEDMEKHCYTHAHIYNNWIETGWVYENGPAGIYSDAAGCGTVFENNVIRGHGSGALLHHCGLENESKNNIVHRNGANSFDHIWAGCEIHSPALQQYSNHHNIYVFDTVEGMKMFKSFHRYFADEVEFYNNLYWSPEAEAEASEIFPGPKLGTWHGVSWAEWKEGGNDTESLWLDPLFKDPASGDFTLAPESPAWLLGISQVDTESIGPKSKKRSF